ncbi:MAG: 50S ribosomal protein L29 [Puniceicoccales bacterium]|jgi:large subunit ribosomal protein L29|nr:50S ribosomal protein L29 [Puniceicoccales bacterium]
MENFREKSPQELAHSLKETGRSLFNLRMQKCSSRLDKPHMIPLLRKQIAKIKTFLRQKTCKGCNK